jgi:signal transduction histidine kinase
LALSKVLMIATEFEAPLGLAVDTAVIACATIDQARARLHRDAIEPDLVVLGFAHEAALPELRQLCPRAEIAIAVSREDRVEAFALLSQGVSTILELPVSRPELEALARQSVARSRRRSEEATSLCIVSALAAPDPATAVQALLDAWQQVLDFDSALFFVFDPRQANRISLVESRAVRSAPPQLPWLEDFLAVQHEAQLVDLVAPHLPPRPATESPLMIAPIRLGHHAVGALVATRAGAPFTAEDLTRTQSLIASSGLILGVPQIQKTLLSSDRLARLGQLTASIGHELRSPLAYVADSAGFLADQLALLARRAESAGDERSSSTLREMVRSAEEAVDGSRRMRELLRDVQGFASADEVTVVPLDLNECVRAAVRLTRVEVRHRFQVICRLEDELLVVGNLPRLTQIFVNLIVNASHALAAKAEQDGHIVLASRRDGNRVLVEVSDNGPGIPSAVLPRIFDAFFTTKVPGEGTGLGLFLCKDIARQHGGTLHARSSATRGATFTLELPAAMSRQSAPPVPRLVSA